MHYHLRHKGVKSEYIGAYATTITLGVLCGCKKSGNQIGPQVTWTCTKRHVHVARGKLRMCFVLFLSMSLLNFGL